MAAASIQNNFNVTGEKIVVDHVFLGKKVVLDLVVDIQS